MEKVNFYSDEPIDFRLIAETYKLVFNKPLEECYWKWRFIANPNSSTIYISYIIKNGELASYYAVSPTTLHTTNGRVFRVALSNMTMTHPGHRTKGYFRLLASSLYDRLRLDDFIAVYGFANSSSHYAFRQYLRWIDLAGLNIMRLSKERFSKPHLRSKSGYTVTVSEANRDHAGRAQTLAASCTGLLLARDTKNLAWRLVENTQNKYYALEILHRKDCSAIIFFKHFGADIDIMEIFVHPDFMSDYGNILSSGFYHLLEAGAGSINIWSNLYRDEHLLLEKLGFVESEFNSYFGFIPLSQGARLKELTDVRNWHYRFMDSDNF